MFDGATYDTCPSFVYAFARTVILKLKSFMVKMYYSILFQCMRMEFPGASEVLKRTVKQFIQNIYFYTK